MKFSVNQQDIQKSLNYCQGVIEKEAHYQFYQMCSWMPQTQN